MVDEIGEGIEEEVKKKEGGKKNKRSSGLIFFFFSSRRRHTRYWRDWSSDVCSSDLDKDHLRRQIRSGLRATVVDLTSAYAVFGVMGPRSRELLSRLSRADLGEEAFPFGTSREIDLGYSTVRATRLTYVGELGWELYAPTEFAVGVYEDLMRAGADLGVINGGYSTIESMRLEKGYRARSE